ncbi:MAG: hypothetical protein JWO19_6123 [Bryobacterales bacterium]|nr:hypothetical protein [Bryobacterales bacterium]
MSSVNFFDGLGQIDLSLIRDEDVAALDDTRREALEILIESVIAKGKATERHAAARKRVHEAMAFEDECLRLHREANPAPTELEALRAAQAAYRPS